MTTNGDENPTGTKRPEQPPSSPSSTSGPGPDVAPAGRTLGEIEADLIGRSRSALVPPVVPAGPSGNTADQLAPLPPGSTDPLYVPTGTDWLKLVGRLTAIEARLAQLEGQHGGLSDQIGALHGQLLEQNSVLALHDQQLDEAHELLSAVHDAVVAPGAPKPMLGRDESRRGGSGPSPVAGEVVSTGGLQVGPTVQTAEGREHELRVDPTRPGQHVVQLPSGGELVINVQDKKKGAVIRDGQAVGRGGTRRG